MITDHNTTTTTSTATETKTTYTVMAKRWKHGWELHIDGIGVTQSKTLATADQMVRDYIETLTDTDVSGAEVVITPELGALGEKVTTVRAQVDAAERAQRDAAAAKRRLADDLRAAGLSVSDTAEILGVSRGRVSQLSSRAS
jgi:DNA-directed RNA polymerase specialized sigma24 family protein